MRRSAPVLLTCLAIGACTPVGGPHPSLQPRAAEAVDPRLPVPDVVNDRPASADLVSGLDALVAQARRGDDAFTPAIATARRLAGAAGSKQSESWIAAQQALSAAQAAREPTAQAMGEIDSIGAERLQRQGGLSPNDLKAIQDAAATVGAIDRRQAAAIDEIQAILG